MGKAREEPLGSLIYESVHDMLEWQSGGNVHLGIILLFTPIAAAARSVMDNGVCDVESLRISLHETINNGTPDDSVNIYKAIDLAMSSENLGEVDSLDVKDESSYDMILKDALTPLDIFRLCEQRDSICSEWVTGFGITFDEGYPYLKNCIESGLSINDAVLSTFIKILSGHPDSLIQRKNGQEEAQRVSEKAKMIGSEEDLVKKRKMIEALDSELSEENGRLNPGTTADLTAASLFLLLLTGWRP
jgi:triphosphoribosyl-dephospho-CoA synthase